MNQFISLAIYGLVFFLLHNLLITVQRYIIVQFLLLI